MKESEKTREQYEQAVQAWAVLLAKGNPLYESSFWTAWALADVLGLGAMEVSRDMDAAKLAAEFALLFPVSA